MTLSKTVAKGSTFGKKEFLSNLKKLSDSEIHHVLNLSLKTMRTYYGLEKKKT